MKSKTKRPATQADPTKPSLGVLVKLGSIAVHVDEATSTTGHAFDAIALRQLLADDEVRSWLAAMDRLALIPRKR